MANLTQVIDTISEIIKFDSSQKPATEGAPFGQETADCLKYFLDLASSFGFETKNYANYAGEVIFGEGEEFAILAHLDVVPAGNGWTHDPFGGEIDNNAKRIWGRGAMDDKGPAVIALYCLKELKDAGFKPNKKIKLIVGCNEENGWQCIDYYKKHAHMPDTGFSPDADFPVIYAEKGILQVKMTFEADGDYSSLKGGDRANMVCDLCETDFTGKPVSKGLILSDGKVISKGKSAHASTPYLGVNAIPEILEYLNLDGIKNQLFNTCFSLKQLKDETGPLTFSPNVISGGKGFVEVITDIRYPASFKEEDILKALKDVKYEVLHAQAPLYNDKNSPLVTTLLGVYNEVTGKNLQPVAIGGGTYARALKNGTAFGPEEEGEESTIHKPNEYITFEKIEKCLKIYRLAIIRLCG